MRNMKNLSEIYNGREEFKIDTIICNSFLIFHREIASITVLNIWSNKNYNTTVCFLLPFYIHFCLVLK